MVAALVATVYFVVRSSRSSKHADLAGTGEGEGLEDFIQVGALYCAYCWQQPYSAALLWEGPYQECH